MLDDARTLHAYLERVPVRALSLFDTMAIISEMSREPEQAEHFLRLAVQLDPEYGDLAARLRTLEEKREE